MAPRVSPLVWVGLVLMLVLAILWECIILLACVPPLSDEHSVLSGFHLLELASGNQTVNFGYIAFCATNTSPDPKNITQICTTVGNPLNINQSYIASELPNVSPGLFKTAFFLSRRFSLFLPASTLLFLCLSTILIIVHSIVRAKNSSQTRPIMLTIFAFLGFSVAFALVQAVALTLATASIVDLTTIANLGFKAYRGELAFRFHWVAFATNVVVAALAGFALPRAGEDDGRITGYDDMGMFYSTRPMEYGKPF